VPEFSVEPRVVAPAHGWAWIASGFALFKRAPGPWIGVFLIWVVIYMIASIIPLGGLFTTLLGAVFLAGWMLGCRSLDRGGELKVEHLFAGFRSEQLGQLVLVGAIYLGGLIAVMVVVALIVGGSMMPLLFGKADPSQMNFTVGMMLGLLLLLGLMLPLLMALWFAPALVVFQNYPPIESMKASLSACLRNIVPFLIYSAILLALAIAAMLPFALGFLVLGPVIFASIYASYTDIFEPAPPAA
jgi:uncharacterized membrane protein